MSNEPPSALAEKVGGVVLLGCGTALAKLAIVDPLSYADAGASNVPVTVKGTVLVPSCFLLGAGLFVLPHDTVWRFLSRPALRHPETHRVAPLGVALIGAVLLPGLALYGWLEWKLAALGYR